MPDRSAEARIAEYLEFARRRPELFGPADAAVKILLDPADIRRVEEDTAAKLRRRGLPESGAEIGIVTHDPYLWFLRDAVEFPDGDRRPHTRAINRQGNGAAALPVLDGRIVLTRQFRHAVRRWSLEVPRGALEEGETPAQAAAAEVEEEIGGNVGELIELGFMNGSTNLYANGAHLFFARLNGVGAPQISEAITSVEQVTVAEFERMVLASEITDSFTIGTFAHARLRGLI
ncbi:MAG TPA: NUDIX hydrolase [Alphaproteobacteria bacterium]|nr:NUDIX hydrolase [Alphaproteobacteria bacterium]